MNWEEMEIFKGIDLNDSFVLSWQGESNEITFELEASIWPESKYYEKPKENEHTCYKPATLSFKNIKKSNGLLEINQVKATTDAAGEIDYGNIDNLEKTKQGFLVEGEFGSVSIIGGEISFEIKKT